MLVAPMHVWRHKKNYTIQHRTVRLYIVQNHLSRTRLITIEDYSKNTTKNSVFKGQASGGMHSKVCIRMKAGIRTRVLRNNRNKASTLVISYGSISMSAKAKETYRTGKKGDLSIVQLKIQLPHD
jgi:hypothetical protein